MMHGDSGGAGLRRGNERGGLTSGSNRCEFRTLGPGPASGRPGGLDRSQYIGRIGPMGGAPKLQESFRRARDEGGKADLKIVLESLRAELETSVPRHFEARLGPGRDPEDAIQRVLLRVHEEWSKVHSEGGAGRKRTFWACETLDELVRYCHSSCINSGMDSLRRAQRHDLGNTVAGQLADGAESEGQVRRQNRPGQILDWLKGEAEQGRLDATEVEVYKAWFFPDTPAEGPRPKRQELVNRFDLKKVDDVTEIVGKLSAMIRRAFPDIGPGGRSQA